MGADMMMIMMAAAVVPLVVAVVGGAVAVPPPPPPPVYNITWPPTYNMSLSTLTNPDGNRTGPEGPHSLARDAQYGQCSVTSFIFGVGAVV
jgi:hypothetical protein